MHLPHLSLLKHHLLHRVAFRVRGTHRAHQLWIVYLLKLGHLILFAPGQPTKIRAREVVMDSCANRAFPAQRLGVKSRITISGYHIYLRVKDADITALLNAA